MTMQKIQSKITLTYVLLTTAVIAILGLISSLTMESYYKNRLIDELATRADLIVSLLHDRQETSLDESDRRIRDLAQTIHLRITLIDSAGIVLVDSDVPLADLGGLENHLQRPEVKNALRNGVGTNTRHSASIGKDFLYVAKRVGPFESGMLRHVRFLRLSIHLEDVQTAVRGIRTNIIVGGCAVLVLVVIVSVFVSRRVAKPVVAIAKSVQDIRSGNLDVRVPITSNDEIGQLARAVNEMVDRLKVDITQLKKLERVRSEFLGNVSHELRTPIFSLQGFLETLIDGAVDDPGVNRAFLQKAYSHAERLNTLLGDLINISQIESGEMKMSFRYFRLIDFLNTVVSDFQTVANRHEVALRFDATTAAEVDVMGDKERLSVALGNLIENAIKYNKPGGEVVISCKREEGKVRIVVADTGVGIPKEHQSRIFERFYRVDKNRSRDVGGTGLGLAIVKHIVDAHGSAVQIESEPGKGSSFSFSLKT